MRLAGYIYEDQEQKLRQLDQYCFDHGVREGTLPKEIVENFYYGDEFDSQNIRQLRLLVLRKLAEHMQKSGCQVFILPVPAKPFRYSKHQPYIYTEKELKDIFIRIDTWDLVSRSPSNRTIVDPLLFRMLYGCGLRLSEALKLTVGDINLDEGVLRIRKSKNKKDRFVPMSQSLAERCSVYNRTMHRLSPLDSYYFPGFRGGRYNRSTIYGRFRQYLWKAGIPHSGNGPRIHDLRHAFCVHRLKKWVLDGHELSNFLPYLAAYLGHADFRGTEYYLRLTADLYPEIVSKMEVAYGYIIPAKEEGQYEKISE
jgi:integrase